MTGGPMASCHGDYGRQPNVWFLERWQLPSSRRLAKGSDQLGSHGLDVIRSDLAKFVGKADQQRHECRLTTSTPAASNLARAHPVPEALNRITRIPREALSIGEPPTNVIVSLLVTRRYRTPWFDLPSPAAASVLAASIPVAEIGLTNTRGAAAMSQLHDTSIVLRAISFAARAHQGQLRKDRCTPYAAHPLRVMTVLLTVFKVDDPELLATAVLHDCIEDTTTDCDDLERQFGVRSGEIRRTAVQRQAETGGGTRTHLLRHTGCRSRRGQTLQTRRRVRQPARLPRHAVSRTREDGRKSPHAVEPVQRRPANALAARTLQRRRPACACRAP